MKAKHIITLLVIFGVLAGFLFVKKLYMSPRVETTEYEALGLSLEAKDIYSIEIKNSGQEESLRFEKKDKKWFIASKWNAKAKKETIEEFLRNMVSVNGELRSSSDKLFSDYGISDEEAYSFSFYGKDGEIIEHLLLGIKKPEFGKSFLRKKDSKDVYLADKDVFPLIGTYAFDDPKEASINTKRWIDLSFMEFDIEEIESINVTRLDEDKKIVTVDVKKILDEEKDLKQWIAQGTEPIFAIDAKKIKGFLNALNRIQAEELVDPEDKDYGLKSPYLALTLKTKDASFEVIVGGVVDETRKNRYIQIADSLVYIISEPRLDDMDIDISKFFIDNPLRVDKNDIETISIVSGEKSIELNKSLIEKNTDYIDKLKKFSIKNILFDETYFQNLKSPASNSCIITTKGGDIVTLEAQKEKSGIYIARLSDKSTVFEIEQKVFEDVFENLDNLDLEEAKSDENIDNTQKY